MFQQTLFYFIRNEIHLFIEKVKRSVQHPQMWATQSKEITLVAIEEKILKDHLDQNYTNWMSSIEQSEKTWEQRKIKLN